MSNTNLFNQPKYVFLPVLIDWLSMKEIGGLDSAMCNAETRNVFLSWLGGPERITFSGILHERYNGTLYWQWLNKRNVHVQYVSLYFQNFDKKRVKRGTCWELMYDKLFNCKASEIVPFVMPQAVLKSPFKVNSLFLSAVKDCNMNQIFPLSTQPLISLKLTHCSIQWDSNAKVLRDFVTSHCSTLTDLVIQDCGQIPDRVLYDVLKKCGDLKHLQLFQHNSPDRKLSDLSSVFVTEQWAFNCVELRSMSFCGLSYVCDALMLSLLSRCPLLQHIMILQCDISDATVEALAQCCPDLISVVLEPARYGFITDEPILAIAESCPHLEYWNVISRASVQTFTTMIDSCLKLKFLNCGHYANKFGNLNTRKLRIDTDSRLSGWFEPYPYDI